MIADQNFYDTSFTFFYPTASATAYSQRPKFFRAEHSATAEGENCAYGPTLNFYKSLQIDLDFLPDSYPDHFMCFMPRKFLYLLYSRDIHIECYKQFK